jgi:hypothetical protein
VIHQIQIKYDAVADRLLMQVRTRAEELFAIWLTRRMVQRLWPPFQQLGAKAALARARPHAVLLPEARAMLADVARQRPLPNADFTQHFNSEDARQPLGPQPLLAAEVELQAEPNGGLRMKVSEAQGRQITLQFNDELHAALSRLFEQALTAADWGLPPLAPPATAQAQVPPVLN